MHLEEPVRALVRIQKQQAVMVAKVLIFPFSGSTIFHLSRTLCTRSRQSTVCQQNGRKRRSKQQTPLTTKALFLVTSIEPTAHLKRCMARSSMTIPTYSRQYKSCFK